MIKKTEFESNLRDINQFGKKAVGRRELIEYLNGKEISRKAAIVAKRYDCCGFYDSGRIDCEIPDCSLYPHMPYRKEKNKTKRVRSEKQIEHDRKLSVLRSGANKNMSGRKLL